MIAALVTFGAVGLAFGLVGWRLSGLGEVDTDPSQHDGSFLGYSEFARARQFNALVRH